METRMERYRIYRNEIINEGELTDKLINDSQIINNYRKQITTLSPKILIDLNINNTLARLISINKNEMKESNTLISFMNLIEEKRFDNLTKEINEWSNKYNQNTIMDEKNGGIKTSWLNEDSGYAKFITHKKQLEVLDSRWINFQTNSKQQVGQIANISKTTDQSNTIAELKTIVNTNQKKTRLNKVLYIVPSVLCVLLIIVMIVLLVTNIANIE